MMKKLNYALCALFATFALVSCDTENVNVSDPEPEADPTYTVKYYMPTQCDLLEFSDVSVEYVDAQGVVQTEDVKELPWQLELTDVAAPFDASFSMTVVKKSPFPEVADGTYSFSSVIGLYIANPSTGGIVYTGTKGSSLTNLEAAGVEVAIDNYVKHSPYSISSSITK